jgi:hypothetical protein
VLKFLYGMAYQGTRKLNAAQFVDGLNNTGRIWQNTVVSCKASREGALQNIRATFNESFNSESSLSLSGPTVILLHSLLLAYL